MKSLMDYEHELYALLKDRVEAVVEVAQAVRESQGDAKEFLLVLIEKKFEA